MYSSGGISDAYGASRRSHRRKSKRSHSFWRSTKMPYILWLGRASVPVEMYFPRIKESVSSCILYPLLSIIPTLRNNRSVPSFNTSYVLKCDIVTHWLITICFFPYWVTMRTFTTVIQGRILREGKNQLFMPIKSILFLAYILVTQKGSDIFSLFVALYSLYLA